MNRERADSSVWPGAPQSHRNGRGNTPDRASHYASVPAGTGSGLVFLFVDNYRLQIFCFQDETAVETFHIIDAIAPSNNHSTIVLAIGGRRLRLLHKADY